MPLNKKTSPYCSTLMKVGLVGAGYIADFHAGALSHLAGIELVSVCDPNLDAARALAEKWHISNAFRTIEEMLSSDHLYCIHVLAPPEQHYSIAHRAIEHGVNVFIEKPMCTCAEEADRLVQLAHEKNVRIGVNHNFLHTHAYLRLREIVKSGALGPIRDVKIDYPLELPQTRLGPFDSWLLREPGNVVLEAGPHPVAALLDLLGYPESLSVIADRMSQIPSGRTVYKRWRVEGAVGSASLTIHIDLGVGFSHRRVFVRGVFGAVSADLDVNTCVLDEASPLSIDLDRFRRTRAIAKQLRRDALSTLAQTALGKARIRHFGNPYERSINNSIMAFYRNLKGEVLCEFVNSGEFGSKVVELCQQIISTANLPKFTPSSGLEPAQPFTRPPTVLVIGAAGFIGKELTRQLLSAGEVVRALIRGSALSLEELMHPNLEVVRGDAGKPAEVSAALQGIRVVYDLSTSDSKTWQQAERNIIEPARVVAEACLSAGVERLIYTGTIASYYTGARAGTITEDTPLDLNMKRRNYYSRAKAAAEELLMSLYRTKGLPVVIVRPGIVIGAGGSPFHWGVGRFTGRYCEVWGDGRNPLPFVLVSDVASALVRAKEITGIHGRSYNLVDTPLLTAREYLNELQGASGVKLKVAFVPAWRSFANDVVKWVLKCATRHPDRVRVPSYRDWEARNHKAFFDSSKARRDLKWNPVSTRGALVENGIIAPAHHWLASLQ